eukprot:395604-Amphidinium_carterae.1
MSKWYGEVAVAKFDVTAAFDAVPWSEVYKTLLAMVFQQPCLQLFFSYNKAALCLNGQGNAVLLFFNQLQVRTGRTGTRGNMSGDLDECSLSMSQTMCMYIIICACCGSTSCDVLFWGALVSNDEYRAKFANCAQTAQTPPGPCMYALELLPSGLFLFAHLSI